MPDWHRRQLANQMFKVVLFVCTLSVQPSDCDELTAVHVIRGPDCKNEIACAMVSQAYLASTALGRTLREYEYVKIRCERKNDPALVGGNH